MNCQIYKYETNSDFLVRLQVNATAALIYYSQWLYMLALLYIFLMSANFIITARSVFQSISHITSVCVCVCVCVCLGMFKSSIGFSTFYICEKKNITSLLVAELFNVQQSSYKCSIFRLIFIKFAPI